MSFLVDLGDCLLLVVDIQEKLLPHIHEKERVVARTARMIQAAEILGVPVLVTEQYPKGLGPTVGSIREALGRAPVHEKTTFGCLATESIRATVEASNRRTLVMVGIECHVCVMQTVLQALERGFRVVMVQDAVGSRSPVDAAAGLERVRAAGAIIATSEMVIFEWLGDAARPEFKSVLPLVR